MLVLKRKQAETVVLDGRIQIKVLRITNNAISLGIDAPNDVAIWRGELEPSAPESLSIPSLAGPAERPLARLA